MSQPTDQYFPDPDSLAGSPPGFLQTIRSGLFCIISCYAAGAVGLFFLAFAAVPGLELVAALALPPMLVALVTLVIGCILLSAKDPTSSHNPRLSQITLLISIAAQAILFIPICVLIFRNPDAPPEGLLAITKLLTAIVTASLASVLASLAKRSPNLKTQSRGRTFYTSAWLSVIAAGAFWSVHAISPGSASIPGMIALIVVFNFFFRFLGIMFRLIRDIGRLTRTQRRRARPRPASAKQTPTPPDERDPLGLRYEPN